MTVAADIKQVWDLLCHLDAIDEDFDVDGMTINEYLMLVPLNGLSYTCVCKCLDCGFDLLPRSGNKDRRSERYMVHDEVWAQTGLDEHGGELCVECIERRLGRELTPQDFSHLPINRRENKTPRLRKRMERVV